VDPCEFYGRMLVVMGDYYSNYIEVESLNKMSSGGVISAEGYALKIQST